MTHPFDASGQPADLIDYDQLSIFLDVGMEEFHPIFRDVVREVPDIFASIREAHASGDEQAFRSRLHYVRGMLSNFGCTMLVEKLHGLERSTTLPPIDPATLHGELTSLWSATRAAIEQWAADQGDS